MAYLVSILSSVLMLAIFEPIDWWWLAPIALVPYAYILFAKDKFSLRQSMIAGVIVSVIFSIGMSFPVLTQFHWYAMAEIMTIGMQLLWVPITLLAITLGAFGSWIFRKLQNDSLADIFLFAAIWVLIESVRRWIFLYFDYGLLGYSMHSLAFMMEFASMGGVLLISFILSLVNGLMAWVIYSKKIKVSEIIVIGLVALIMFISYFLNHAYLYSNPIFKKSVSVSIIQINEKKNPFGKFDSHNNFILEERTENMIKAAALQEPDYLIYPFNIVGGILTDGSYSPVAKDLFSGTFDNLGDWLGSFLPDKTNFVMWTNTMRNGGGVAAEINYWKKNSLVAYYQKRKLFPFIDFTPAEIQKFGIYTTPLDFSAGSDGQMVSLDNINVGNLICSELNVPSLASHDAKKSDVIFAIGSAAIFRDNIMGDRNIVLAQFRAAENNIPIVRADRKGPSVVVGPRGEIIASLPFGIDGILKSEILINQHKQTIYGRIGDLWISLVSLLILFLIFAGKYFHKKL